MKKSNKILAVLLALVMILTAVPMMTAIAAEEEHVHSFKVVGEVTEATCTDDGEAKYACACGLSFTITTEKVAHVLIGTIQKNDADTHKQFCDTCGKYVPADHVWEDVKVTKEATCTEKGEKEVKCTACGETAKQATDALGHTYSLVVPNLTSDGKDMGTHAGVCTVCKEPITEDHTWDEGVVTTTPKCNKEGELTISCTVCTAKETKVIPACHTAGDKAVSVDDETHKYTCIGSLCGYDEFTNEELAKVEKSNNHKYVVVVGTESTCDGTVALTVTCEDCDYKLETKATEHKFGDAENFDKDSHKQICENCDLAKTTPHNWKDVVVVPATCDKAGSKLVRCEDCGETATQEIPASGEHDWTEWEVKEEATVEKEGSKARECKNCGEIEVEAIAKLEVLPGDVEGNGKVQAMDARYVLQHVAGLITLTEEQQKAADMDGNGKIQAIDARYILQAVAGITE